MTKSNLAISDQKGAVHLDKYAGCWVAISRQKVIAHQNTLEKLMKKVKKSKLRPSVLFVPEKSDGPHVL